MPQPVELRAALSPVVGDHAHIRRQVDEGDPEHEHQAGKQEERDIRVEPRARDEAAGQCEPELREDRVGRRLVAGVDLGEELWKRAVPAQRVPHARTDIRRGKGDRERRGHERDEDQPPTSTPEVARQCQARQVRRARQAFDVVNPEAGDDSPVGEDQEDTKDDDREQHRPRHVALGIPGFLGQRGRGLPTGESLHGQHDGERESGQPEGGTHADVAWVEWGQRESAWPWVDEASNRQCEDDQDLGAAGDQQSPGGELDAAILERRDD